MLKDVGLDERVTSDDLKEDIHLILRSPQYKGEISLSSLADELRCGMIKSYGLSKHRWSVPNLATLENEVHRLGFDVQWVLAKNGRVRATIVRAFACPICMSSKWRPNGDACTDCGYNGSDSSNWKQNLGLIVGFFERMFRMKMEAHDDVDAWDAPSECHRDVQKGFERSLARLWIAVNKVYGISPKELEEECQQRTSEKFVSLRLNGLLIP